MGITSWFRRKTAAPENRAFDEGFWEDLFARPSASGVSVNWNTALQTPAALRSGMLLSDGVSTVPLKLMLKTRDGKRVEATDHPLFDLMSTKPCSWMTSQQYRETSMLRAVFVGQSFSFINRVSSGRVMEVFPFDVGECSVGHEDGIREPVYRVNGERVPSDRILHWRGPSWDSRKGLDLVSLARDAIGLAVATQNAHSKVFANGLQTSGVYSVEGNLTADQHAKLLAFLKRHTPSDPLIIDRNGKFTPHGLKGVDAEHLATRQYQDSQIAMMFGVLPIMLGISDKTATYASAEQMFIAHAKHTIRPWHRRVEAMLNCWLLTAQERSMGYYFHFADGELLRGAAKDRAEFYAKLFSVGAFSPNMILSFEDMDGFDGGDSHFVQGANGRIMPDGSLQSMSTADTGGRQNTDDQNQNIADRLVALFSRLTEPKNAGRVLSGENEGLIRDARDNLDTVLDKLDA